MRHYAENILHRRFDLVGPIRATIPIPDTPSPPGYKNLQAQARTADPDSIQTARGLFLWWVKGRLKVLSGCCSSATFAQGVLAIIIVQ